MQISLARLLAEVSVGVSKEFKPPNNSHSLTIAYLCNFLGDTLYDYSSVALDCLMMYNLRRWPDTGFRSVLLGG